MEMARVARGQRGRQMIGRALRIVAGALALGAAAAAGGCGKPLCPTGMQVDSKRSTAGANAFCVNPTDKSRSVYIDLYPNGARRQICAFVDGKASGPYAAFHPGGARWLEGRYEDGRKVGRWTQWAADGRKVADGVYRQGLTVEGAPVGFPATCESVVW